MYWGLAFKNMPFLIPCRLFLFVLPLLSGSYYGSNLPQWQQICSWGSFPFTSCPCLQHPVTGRHGMCALDNLPPHVKGVLQVWAFLFALITQRLTVKRHCLKLQNIDLFAFYTFQAIFRYQITSLEFTSVTIPAAWDAESSSEPNLIQSTSAQLP